MLVHLGKESLFLAHSLPLLCYLNGYQKNCTGFRIENTRELKRVILQWNSSPSGTKKEVKMRSRSISPVCFLPQNYTNWKLKF